jgi:hypothetical protein
LSSSLFEKGLPSLVQSLVVWFGYLLLWKLCYVSW